MIKTHAPCTDMYCSNNFLRASGGSWSMALVARSLRFIIFPRTGVFKLPIKCINSLVFEFMKIYEKRIASMQSCVLRKNESLLCSLVFDGKTNRFHTVSSFTEKSIASIHSCVLRKNESLLCSLVFYGKMNRFYAVL